MALCVILLILYYAAGVQAKVYFKEEFMDDSWTQRWICSQHPSKEGGKFVLSSGKFYGDPEINKGIQTTQDENFYGVTTKFEPFSNKDKVLVIQYTVKHEQNIKCGGGYIKIFDCNFSPKNFHAYIPYLILFGPDICGADKKIKVMFNYNDRKLSMKTDVRCRDDVFTHLYTLVIKPDNTYIIKVDNIIERTGKLEEDWDFLPPRKNDNVKGVDSINHTKPKIIRNIKPSDDRDQEHLIEAVQSDNGAELDGDLELSRVNRSTFDEPNNKSKDNQTDNQADNQAHEPEFYKYDEICGVGFDLWQVESGTIFDNVLITDDELEAEKHGEDNWRPFVQREKIMKIIVDKGLSADTKSRPIKHDEF